MREAESYRVAFARVALTSLLFVMIALCSQKSVLRAVSSVQTKIASVLAGISETSYLEVNLKVTTADERTV